MRIRTLLYSVLLTPLLANAAIVNYPNPNSSFITAATEYVVTGDTTTIPVYNLLNTNGTVNGVTQYTNFRVARFAFANAANPCRVYVTYNNTSNVDPQAPGIQSYTISPASAVEDVRQTNSNTITFRMPRPANVEVAINGGTTQDTDAHASKILYIFADAPQTTPETGWTTQNHPSDVYYFGPGDNDPPSGAVITGGSWLIDGTTDTHKAIYFAPGAVLNYNIKIQNMRSGDPTTPSFKVYGPGYIRDVSRIASDLTVRDSTYVTLQDVCLFNAKAFSLHLDATRLGDSSNITATNIRALGIEVNSDGVQIVGPIHDSVVQNCFIAGNDNLIVLGGGSTNSAIAGPSNFTVQQCTFVKTRPAGNWFFTQGNSIKPDNPTPGGEIGVNNVVTDCEVIRANSNQVGLVTDWWGDLRNVGTATTAGVTISNLQIDSLAQYQYGSPSSTSPYLNNVVALGMTGPSQSDLPTERPVADSSGNPYNRSLILRNVYLPTLTTPQTNYVKSNWKVTFDHVYVNNVPVTSNSDLSLTQGSNATVTYKYTFPPTGLTATAQSGTQVNLQWNAAASNVTVQGYNVYWAPSLSGPWDQANINLITGTTYAHTTAQGTTYYYVVAAVDSVTESPVSSVATVTTPINVTGVTVAPASGDGTLLAPGATLQMVATVSPSNATNKAVTWVSNSTDVATVNSNGLVTAVAIGTAKITATTVDQGFSAYSHVAVPYPAASASYTGGAVSTNNHTGALTGGGYFADFPSTGGSVTFANVDGGGGGSSKIIIRYSMATGPRTGTLTVNGVVQSITFSQTTTNWDTWTTMSVIVPGITAGRTNTIKFTSTGSDLPNIDYIAVFD
jgi:hypothetical protein